jgi:hypothetical protein
MANGESTSKRVTNVKKRLSVRYEKLSQLFSMTCVSAVTLVLNYVAKMWRLLRKTNASTHREEAQFQNTKTVLE